MTINPFPDKADNVNAFELVNSINLLLETKQWNDVLRHFAASSPKEFIRIVEDFRETGLRNDMFASPNVDFWLTDMGPNKINCIKVLRELFGLGLADAKYSAEAAPCKLFTALSDSDMVAYAYTKLKECGSSVELRTVTPSDTVFKKISGVASYNVVVPAGWSRTLNFTTPPIK